MRLAWHLRVRYQLQVRLVLLLSPSVSLSLTRDAWTSSDIMGPALLFDLLFRRLEAWISTILAGIFLLTPYPTSNLPDSAISSNLAALTLLRALVSSFLNSTRSSRSFTAIHHSFIPIPIHLSVSLQEHYGSKWH